jgi:tRNA(Ile)-lysidine synthase
VEALLGRCTFPPAGSALVCAVSGGPDSLALLVLACAAGCRVTAVHVDHGLRPGSAEEADVVRRAARRFGAAFRSEQVVVGSDGGPEAGARAARFAVLPPDVATGHTMDDQAETVLLNLLRGAGADGLSAMAPGPRHPLLGLRRSETVALCAALGLTPVADPSNDDPLVLRNRVRHELLPLCATLSARDPVPVLARQADLLRDESALLDRWAADAVADPADARAVAAAPPALARRVLRRWLRDSGATAATGGRAGSTHPPSAAQVERVLAVARGDAVATELGGGVRVRRSAGRLAAQPKPRVAAASPAEPVPPAGPVPPGET